ncbi:MAG: AAA family ATPase [Polyangiales bacterium]
MDQAARPERLRSLRIENLRGIDHLELELPETDEQGGGMLVLAGANGCGKTTVLEAVLMTLRRIDLLPRDLAAPSELVRQGARDFEIASHWSLGTANTWHVDRRELTKMMEAFAREATVTQSVESLARPLTKDLRTALHPPEFNVEYISSRREPEDLGEPVSGPRGRRSTREERRLAELQRRLVNAHGRLGSERVFQRLNRFYGSFVGSQWQLDVIYRSAELGSDRLVVVRDGELPVSDQGVVNTLDEGSFGEGRLGAPRSVERSAASWAPPRTARPPPRCGRGLFSVAQIRRSCRPCQSIQAFSPTGEPSPTTWGGRAVARRALTSAALHRSPAARRAHGERSLDDLRARAAQGEPTPRVIPVDRLSSGQMALLAMASASSTSPSSTCTRRGSGCSSARSASSPKTQFLVATHSPLVLDSVYSVERVLLTDDLDDRPAICAAAGGGRWRVEGADVNHERRL